MKKIFLFILVISLGAISCINSKKTENVIRGAEIPPPSSPVISQGETRPLAEGWKFDTLRFDKKIYIDNDTTKDGMRIELNLVYPTYAPEGVNLNGVQKSFARIFAEGNDFSGTPTESFNNTVEKYKSDAIGYGEEWLLEGNEYISFSNFEQTKGTSPEYVSKYIITVSTGQYAYLGGAHGSYYLQYNNIDLRDGNIINESMLFRPGYESKLAQLIQEAVTERNNSADEDEHISLLVEIPEIKPNSNFFFSDDGIIYIYNQYEISPYVQGVVEIIIPYEEIEPLVNERYMEAIEGIHSKLKQTSDNEILQY